VSSSKCHSQDKLSTITSTQLAPVSDELRSKHRPSSTTSLRSFNTLQSNRVLCWAGLITECKQID